MIIPTIANIRGLVFTSIVVLGAGIFVSLNNSKEKTEYEKSTGTIIYFENEYLNLPTRHKGDYRYLKINSYPYLFEIYEPNSEETERSIDDLKIGDKIDIYFYETSDTRNIGMNKFTQFIDKDGEAFFIRNGFQKQLGFSIIGLSLLMNILAFILWRKGKTK